MKKVLLTLMALLTIVCGTNAKTVETTLWNDTYTDGVELSGETVATFKAGDVLRVYVTVPEGGANFKIVYKGASNDWAETTIPSLDTQWPWVNGDEAYKDIAFTAADITAFLGNNIYIYKGNLLIKDDYKEELYPAENASGNAEIKSIYFDHKHIRCKVPKLQV